MMLQYFHVDAEIPNSAVKSLCPLLLFTAQKVASTNETKSDLKDSLEMRNPWRTDFENLSNREKLAVGSRSPLVN